MFRLPFVYIQVYVGYVLGRIVGSQDSVRVDCDALSNPRTLMGDYNIVEGCFRELHNGLKGKTTFFIRPRVLIHLMPKFENGYTNVELRAFREAAEASGFAKVLLLADHDALTDTDLVEMKIK